MILLFRTLNRLVYIDLNNDKSKYTMTNNNNKNIEDCKETNPSQKHRKKHPKK